MATSCPGALIGGPSAILLATLVTLANASLKKTVCDKFLRGNTPKLPEIRGPCLGCGEGWLATGATSTTARAYFNPPIYVPKPMVSPGSSCMSLTASASVGRNACVMSQHVSRVQKNKTPDWHVAWELRSRSDHGSPLQLRRLHSGRALRVQRAAAQQKKLLGPIPDLLSPASLIWFDILDR